MMPKSQDLTNALYRLRETNSLETAAQKLPDQTSLGRRLAPDWFFRGVWILLGLVLLTQILLPFILG